MLYRLSRLTGTTLLEGLCIIDALYDTSSLDGSICEYGVAHGKTSALLAQVMYEISSNKDLWLYDSFEGLPQPHSKDELLNDIFGLGDINLYKGTIATPKQTLVLELSTVNPTLNNIKIIEGWITADSLKSNSPSKISFAYLDMDFYESTYAVLDHLSERLQLGGIAILDDYGFFSSGVKTAAEEIMTKYDGVFQLTNPYNSKFAIVKKVR